jgi:Glycosyl hydrolase family 1
VQALRVASVAGDIGISLNLSDVHPASTNEQDLAAAARIDGNENRWFLDPIHKGAYPQTCWPGTQRAPSSALRDEDLRIGIASRNTPSSICTLRDYAANVDTARCKAGAAWQEWQGSAFVRVRSTVRSRREFRSTMLLERTRAN